MDGWMVERITVHISYPHCHCRLIKAIPPSGSLLRFSSWRATLLLRDLLAQGLSLSRALVFLPGVSQYLCFLCPLEHDIFRNGSHVPLIILPAIELVAAE